jgi:hypothetical protein
LIIAICLAGLQLGLTFYFMAVKKSNANLNDLIFQDCLMLDKTQTTLNDYFLNNKRRESTQTNQNVLPPNKNEDLNTSRYLQEGEKGTSDQDKPKNLILQDNNLNDVENIVNKTLEHAQSNEKEIQIHNNFVAKKNASIEMDPKTLDTTNQYRPTTESMVTMRDYESLTIEERFGYDNRSFFNYFKYNMIRTNILFSIFFKVSILDPIHIRVAKLIFSISLIFGTNAFWFSDYYIEQRINEDNKVNKFIYLSISYWLP